MTIAIKTLNYDDVSILKNVDPGVFDYPINQSRAEEFLADPRHHLVVAIKNDQVIGFSAVHYVHPDKPRPELWINEVSVAGTYRFIPTLLAFLVNALRLSSIIVL